MTSLLMLPEFLRPVFLSSMYRVPLTSIFAVPLRMDPAANVTVFSSLILVTPELVTVVPLGIVTSTETVLVPSISILVAPAATALSSVV